MKKKALIIFLSIFGLMFALIGFFGTARPPYGDSGHAQGSCHGSSGGYTISKTDPVTNGEYTTFSITATGSNVFVQAYPGAKDNDLFTILPSNSKIVDGSGEDTDPSADSITVVFNVTTAVIQNSYTLFIIAGDDVGGGQEFTYVEIIIGVAPTVDLWATITNHLGMYLGFPALLLLSLGTVLVLVNESKYVKMHGILAGSSWILTVVNVSAAVINIPLQSWLNVYELIYHLPHIILGAIGLVTGFFSMLFGIAAERKPARLTGYLTLICWWAAFFTGYLMNSNLLIIIKG
ncbi:hypothetical protein LCGC14_1817620 [marine sediment metagenome]|uniref:Uncharacterized protein n=1 Tax=marine sediment metagenome TaxID=412755 RepID=A0A0F9GJX5_9ZZZZ